MTPTIWSSSRSPEAARGRRHSPTAARSPAAMEIIGPKGKKIRMIDEVDLITGVSGGSFTALAYGLYGEKLFDIYETAS